jgi:DNA-binding transcriptional LysR family regulator
MSLQSHQLDAFMAIAKTRNFSKAADELHVTQSALSHRIAALEEEIGAPLFIRERLGVQMTELGQELLQFVKVKNSLEEDFLAKIKDPKANELRGGLRVGCYASIGRSVILKALSPFLKANPRVQLFFMVREMKDLPDLLKSGEADLIFLDYDAAKGKIRSEHLADEHYQLVESKEGCANPDLYLNHDEADLTTFKFYEKQGKKNHLFSRSYLDEIYSCLDGVANGIGRSVLPLHLVREYPKIKVIPGYQHLVMPVVLHYYETPVMPPVLKQAIEALRRQVPGIFNQK